MLTHCQVLGEDLIRRMVAGGVIANIQPSFVPTDMRWVQERLTPIQQQYSYAWKVSKLIIRILSTFMLEIYCTSSYPARPF